LAAMEAQGRAVLSRSLAPETIGFRRSADVRYRRQGYDLTVPVPTGALGEASAPVIQAAFEDAYRAIYGQTPQNVELDVISWRVVAQGPAPRLALPPVREQSADAATAQKGERAIFLTDRERLADVPVYDRYKLGPGAAFQGPAIIEERESTVVLPGPCAAHVDAHANLIVDL
ncbi:MAG: hydantoinase/oxoprolinase family protein, partial [Pseudomonadota bacterium]